MGVLHPSTLLRYFGQVFLFLVGFLPATYFPIRSDIYFEIVGPTAFLPVRTDGPTVFGKFEIRKLLLAKTCYCYIILRHPIQYIKIAKLNCCEIRYI